MNLRRHIEEKQLRARWRHRAALRMLEEGLTSAEVAGILGMTTEVVHKRYDVPLDRAHAMRLGPKTMSKACAWRRRVARRLVNYGFDIEEVAELFNLAPRTVVDYFKKAA